MASQPSRYPYLEWRWGDGLCLSWGAKVFLPWKHIFSSVGLVARQVQDMLFQGQRLLRRLSAFLCFLR